MMEVGGVGKNLTIISLIYSLGQDRGWGGKGGRKFDHYWLNL